MLFVCPLCKKQLNTDSGKSAVCPSGHSFDKSRKGYYNLLIGRGGAHGDNKEMVIARRAFLERGLYEPLASFVAGSVAELIPFGGAVLDAGCGEGYYTQKISEAGYKILGLDLSKFGVHTTAVRLKCNINDKAFACVSSIFEPGSTAKPFTAHHNALDQEVYLRISPELTLKKLIIGGFNNVYEVARDFRNEGMDANHLQDFTMVEGYSAYWNYEDNMKFLKEMIIYILSNLYISLV